MLDNIQDVPGDTLCEADLDNTGSYIHYQQSQTSSTAKQMVRQPDPNMIIADPDMIPEYQKCKDQIGIVFLLLLYMFIGAPQDTGIIPLMS